MNSIIQFFRQGEAINLKNYKFFFTMNGVYVIAFVLHIFLMLAFGYFQIPFMVKFNLFISLPTFAVAFFINRRGLHNTAFLITIIEVTLHQAFGVYFLGFESGLQYYLLIMPLIAFFNRAWPFFVHLPLVLFTGLVLVSLIMIIPPEVHAYTGEERIAIKGLKVLNAISAIAIISLVAYHFVQITVKAESSLKVVNNNLRDKNHAIMQKNHEIEQQAQLLDAQKKQMLSSIHYAQHIQNALLPDTSILKDFVSDYFVMLRPRDIVSGDFYWFYQKNNKLYVLAADATGHGVPGAFMSVMGLSYLEHIIMENEGQGSAYILDDLRTQVKSSLSHANQNTFKDGFDLSLLIFDFSDYTYHFSAAYNPIYVNQNGQLKKLEGDRQPVGIYPREKPFTQMRGRFRKGDLFYLASDGFSDQLGGSRYRKYTKKQLRNKLESIGNEQMQTQHAIMQEELDKWMQNSSGQVDDILLIGISI